MNRISRLFTIDDALKIVLKQVTSNKKKKKREIEFIYLFIIKMIIREKKGVYI